MGIADAICTGIGRDIKSDLVYGREGQVTSPPLPRPPPSPFPCLAVRKTAAWVACRMGAALACVRGCQGPARGSVGAACPPAARAPSEALLPRPSSFPLRKGRRAAQTPGTRPQTRQASAWRARG